MLNIGSVLFAISYWATFMNSNHFTSTWRIFGWTKTGTLKIKWCPKDCVSWPPNCHNCMWWFVHCQKKLCECLDVLGRWVRASLYINGCKILCTNIHKSGSLLRLCSHQAKANVAFISMVLFTPSRAKHQSKNSSLSRSRPVLLGVNGP